MRNAFSNAMTALASKNENIVVLSGDIGNRMFDSFKQRFPERFYNCGVAEANMMSMAAGMAVYGLRPFLYTIAPFITLRCFEQIKIDVCYHNLSVVIVGTGAGMSYASLGPTHHTCEDIAIMRALPNMTVICPGDAVEVSLSIRATLDWLGPVYIRLGKKGEQVVHKGHLDFVIGRAIIIRKGSDVCLLSTGNSLGVAMQVRENLEKKNISTQLVSFHTVKPLDCVLLSEVFSRFNLVVTMEEHSLVGGFGAGVAEWLADQSPSKGQLLRLGLKDCFFSAAGSQEYLRRCMGLTPEAITEAVESRYKGKK